jgi:acyl transferase domain-containing protein
MVHQEIAIVGMACRVPKADSYQDFWNLLLQGQKTVGDWPEARRHLSPIWANCPALDSVAECDRIRAMKGGFLTGVEEFDARFFSISPREARLLDPQHRLLMTQSWQALLDSAIDPRTLDGSNSGVFFGLCSHDYGLIGHEMPERVGPYSALGAAHCIASNHISFSLGLQGPSITVDAACAASAMSIHLAVQSLRAGECDLAIAGGANLVLVPGVNMSFEIAKMLSTAGRCAAFDLSADGYVRSEAVGVVVLKRLEDAGDDLIHAVIAATGSNQDGRTSSITVPNGKSQQALINQCHGKAGISAQDIAFVEAHGTGTPVGDPIEAQALAQVFGQQSSTCYVGSLKANFGHAEAAAGVLSVIKSALAVSRRRLPPHVGATNPIAPFSDPASPLKLPTEAVKLQSKDSKPIYAGVSAFGFGGTNVHIIVRSNDVSGSEPEGASPDTGEQQLVVSAHTNEAIDACRRNWSRYLSSLDQDGFTKACLISQRAYGGERFRLEVTASSPQMAADLLLQTSPSVGAERAMSKPELRGRPDVPPPLYSFMEKRFWAYDYLPEAPVQLAGGARTVPDTIMLDFGADYIANHRIAGAVIVPGASIMMAIRNALAPFFAGSQLDIRNVRFRTAMMIDPADPERTSQAVMRLGPEPDGGHHFELSRSGDDTVFADGIVIGRIG